MGVMPMGRTDVGREFSLDYKNEPVCPHCGEEVKDAWDYGFEEDRQTEIQCPNCEKEFWVIANVTITYSTGKIKPKEGEAE